MRKIISKGEIKQTDVENLKDSEVQEEVFTITDLIRKQAAEIDTAINGRQAWQDKQDKWYRQRYGVRQKAVFPWYNASSLHLPMQDSTIRKLKPEYVAVGYNTSPMCELSLPRTDYQDNQKENLTLCENASWYFDWLLRAKMDVFEPTVLMVDKMMHKGFSIVKTIYEKNFEPTVAVIERDKLQAKLDKELLNPEDADLITNPNKINLLAMIISRQYGFLLNDPDDYTKVMNICLEIYKGAEAVEFTYEEKIYDAPRWIVLDPEEIVVPANTNAVFDLERAPWIDHIYYISPAMMLKNGLNGKWDMAEVEEQLNKCGIYDKDLKSFKYKDKAPAKSESTSQMQKRVREGLDIAESNTDIKIHEVCLWYDSDGDHIEERHVLEFVDGSENPLRFIRYPYNMKMWPYVKVIFELSEARHYSNRGTVEIEEPLAVALNVQHNMKINRQTIHSTPTLLYAVNKVNPYNLQYIPGQATPVEPPIDDHAKWFMPPNTDDTFMREEATLRAWDTDYMAVNDFGTQQNNDETATKTNYNASTRVGIRTLDIQIFQKALKELYKRTWALQLQYCSDNKLIFTDADGATLVLDRVALFRDFQFQPMGSFGSSNPQLSAQVAARQFEEFKGDMLIDQYELYREHITKQSDVRTCKRILKSKEQIAADQKAAMQAAQQERIVNLNEQIILANAGASSSAKIKPFGQQDRRGMTQIKGNQKEIG
jgi:hypothetical protein